MCWYVTYTDKTFVLLGINNIQPRGLSVADINQQSTPDKRVTCAQFSKEVTENFK